MKIAICEMQNVDLIWGSIAEGIHESCEKSWDAIPVGQLHQMCRSGHAFLILAHDGEKIHGATIWQFRTVDNKPVFQALALCGENFGDWMPAMREKIREMAKANGAVSLIDQGRPGMGKLFERYGAHPVVRTVTYEEEL